MDDVISKSQSDGTDALPNVQISGIEAVVVNNLKLVDHGFYVYSSSYDMSLSRNIVQFANGMAIWCKKLKMVRSQCIKNGTVNLTALQADKRNLSQSNQDRGSALKSWIRGTFIIPAAGSATFPKNFLTCPMAGQNEISQQYTYEERILADGTVVFKLRDKPMNDMKKKKRKSKQAVDDNSNNKRKCKHQSQGSSTSQKDKHREQVPTRVIQS